MRQFVPATALCALVLCSTSIGFAQAEEVIPPSAVGVDIVALKNGGMLRGTVIAVEPDKQVIIVVGGEKRIVPWTDITRVEQGKEIAPPPPPQTTTPTTTQSPQTVGPGTPFIHIESDWPDVQLGRIDSEPLFATSSQNLGAAIGAGLVRPVCRAPCDRVVDGREGTRFVVISPGMVPSDPFFLDNKNGHLVARVQGGSVGKRFGGFMLTTFGGCMTLGGIAVLGVALGTNAFSDPETRPLGTAGAIVFGLGAAQLIPGIMLLAGSSTKVEITPDGAVAMGRFRFDGRGMSF
jgi:hypothetical protein